MGNHCRLEEIGFGQSGMKKVNFGLTGMEEVGFGLTGMQWLEMEEVGFGLTEIAVTGESRAWPAWKRLE
jgi:translation elongation factor EF-1beta